jgi:protein O-GlcNAc transferase
MVPAMTIDEVLQTAAEHHDAGRLADAEALYREVLERDPEQADAMHFLGLLCFQAGRPAEALELLDKAVALQTDVPELYATQARVLAAVGRADDAIAAWQKALDLQPDDPAGQSALGGLLWRQGRKEQAIAAFRAAVKLKPDDHASWSNLGSLLMERNQLEEAVAACRRSVELQPDVAEAWINLGIVLRAHDKGDQAAEAYRRAIAIRPGFVEAYCNLTIVLCELKLFDVAFEVASSAVKMQPDHAPAHNNLGIVLKEFGKTEAAMNAYWRAIELNPKLAEAYNNLGLLLRELGRPEESVVAYNKALAIDPGFADAWSGLGNAHHDCDRLDDALAAYRKALDIRPNHSDAMNNMGNVLLVLGRTEEALRYYDEAISIRPDSNLGSNKIFALLMDERQDAPAILAACRDWDARYAAGLGRNVRVHENDRSADRRLRIGYISADFRRHVVGWNLAPLLTNHDKSQVEVFCYSAFHQRDVLTERFMACADAWRDIVGIGNEQAAQMIREDRIDILVDLAVHSSGNRLLLFARKPAPVQVTYLGYCGTTGLGAMGYRLSDIFIDPPGSDVSCYSERTIVLPRTYWCYEPAGPYPEVGPLPARTAGHITFGSMNNSAKASHAARELWAKVLLAVPGSHLLIHSHPGSHQESVLRQFVEAGVAADRIELVARQSWADYIQTYNRIDIALDSLPYNGGITSFDTLIMGVPVVTLRGRTSVGRAGCSILNNIGLKDLIATSAAEYVRIATKLAGDLPRLAELRAGMRKRMEGSPLRDAEGFARDVEAAYRRMWRQWCER